MIPLSTRTRGRERAVLAGGLLSTVALLWAALALHGDPERAGQSRLARQAGEVSDGIVAEWERLRRDEMFWNEAAGSIVRWTRPVDDEEGVEPFAVREWSGARADGFAAFDALFAEANRLERAEGDATEALAVVLEALDKDADPPRIAQARLRAIQLARRLERSEVAREQWRLAATELNGSEAREGVAYLLLDALAAAELLDAEERAAARDRLVGLWATQRLALPETDAPIAPGALPHPTDDLRDALRAMVQELGAEPDPRLEAAALVERGRRIARATGTLPPLPDDRGFAVWSGDEVEITYTERDGIAQGVFLDPGAMTTRLRRALTEHELVPEEFTADFTGDEEGAGVVVRDRTPLPHSSLEFRLRHRDPRAIVEAEASRVRFVRAALVVLALFTGGAAFTTVRLLRREQALARAKTSFVANVSHELRTPLSSILLMAENLERGVTTSDEARARYHGLIRREAQRLRRLVDDVLDFSRVERGEELRLRIEDVDPERFAAELEQDLADRAASTTFAFRTVALPAHARFDEETIRRALFNLVDNAVKYGAGSAIEVEVEGGDGSLRLAVRDHGPGVDAKRREAIFAAFTRLEGNGEKTAGTGLGLAIVREIARAHGGTVRCGEPAEGTGARFEIRLPLDGGHAAPEDA